MSTLAAKNGRLGAKTLAVITSLLVALSGLLITPAAQAAETAAGAAAKTTVQSASAAGLEIRVEFSGVAPSPLGPPQNMGVYAALVKQGTVETVGQGNWVTPAQMPDGAGSTTFVAAPADGLNRDTAYELLIWYAHGNPSDEAIVLRQAMTVTDEQWNLVFPPAPEATATSTTLTAAATTVEAGASVSLTATVAPTEAAGSVAFVDAAGAPVGSPQQVTSGSATVTTQALAAGSHAFTATFTPADAAAFAPSTSAAISITATEETTPVEPAEPTVAAAVTGASTTGLELSATIENIVLRAAADVPDTGKDDQGVYVGIIEKDRVDEYAADAKAGATQDFAYKTLIKGGKVTRDISVPADKLDRSKQYVAVSWLAHGMMTKERYLGQADLKVSTAQWDAVFPPKIAVKAAVKAEEASAKKLELDVQASGIALRPGSETPSGRPDAGVYIGIIEKSRVGEYATDARAGVSQTSIGAGSIVDGKFTQTVTIAADELTAGAEYVAVIWRSHGYLTEASFVGQADVQLSWSQWQELTGEAAMPTSVAITSSAPSVSAGHSVGLVATVTAFEANPTDKALPIGTVQFFADGQPHGKALPVSLVKKSKTGATQITSPEIAEGDARVFTAEFTPLDAGDYAPSKSADVTVTGTEATGPWNPQIEVFLKINGEVTPYTGQKVYRGDEIVVRGSGFDPEANVGGRGMPLPYGPQGSYVVFGNFTADKWRPSQGFPATARAVSADAQGWVLARSVFDTVPAMYKPAVQKQWVEPTEGGSFEWTTKLVTPKELAPGGKFGVYSYGAGSVNNAAEELEVAIDYVDAVRPGNPAITVTLPNGTPYTNQELREGDKLVVKGTGFDPYANLPENPAGGMPIPNSLPQGTFVVFGSFANEWQPSKGAAGATRTMHKDSRKWALAEDTLEAVPAQFRETIRKEWVEIDPATGAFEATLTLHTPESPLEGGTFGVYTYAGGAGQAANAAQELQLPVNYKTKTTEPEVPVETVGGLDWAFNTGWNGYVRFVAGGTITGSKGATTDASGLTNYTQVKGGNYDPKTGIGSIHYEGTVRYQSQAHGFDIAIKDPRITFTSATVAELSAEISNTDTAGVGSMSRVVMAKIAPGASALDDTGLRSWAKATGVFAKLSHPEGWVDYSGKDTAPLSFSFGTAGTVDPGGPDGPGITPPKPQPKPQPKPVGSSGQAQAGSLSWGISAGFKDYITGRIAKGAISTSGVGGSGGAYLFPQAAGGSWNAATQTGTVQFSGVVTFTGHRGLLNEPFANPVITVTSATSGTLSAGGRTFGLDLGAASKSVGANGEVTWSGVPVSGSISGGGSAGGAAGSGSFAADPLSFTVGAASRVQFGSTTQTEQKAEREPAATAPTTEGIRVITPKEELVPGGTIEFVAAGFEADERDVLVVLYSDPIVLDKKAGANQFGEVRWIGQLPDDLEPGKHTITLQGSKDAGAIIDVIDPKKAKQDKPVVKRQDTGVAEAQAAGVIPEAAGGAVWMWWAGAGALLILAAALTALVVRQRRAAGGANVD
ncbi:HtaA domain-containing protein [Leucobacter albus]|uniref:HtaA domain-containing protein n=1 Tax=Leucobacter albus TaxID=272210 RepID=A0ABW3TPW8_9MICO